jgi:hypothetical protein
LPFSRVIWIQGFTTKALIDETMANFVKIGKRGKEGMKREKPSPSQKSKTQLALITGKGTNHSIRPV